MRSVSDPDNQEAGLKALDDLRTVAKDVGVIEDRQAKKTDVAAQKKAREERQNTIAARERGLGELHAKYMELALNPDGAQQRGYDLQDLLKGLFKLHDILYQPPYRKGTVEETDGFFTFRGFDYLLEARWRKTQPPIADLRAFSGKVKAKIESTRGLFLSIPGFRDGVVTEAVTLSNLILMDGQELALILEAASRSLKDSRSSSITRRRRSCTTRSQLTSEERAAARYADASTKATVLRKSVRTRAGQGWTARHTRYTDGGERMIRRWRLAETA